LLKLLKHSILQNLAKAVELKKSRNIELRDFFLQHLIQDQTESVALH